MYFDVPTRKPKYRNYVSYTIDDQTIHFWNLQLQFMQMSCFTLVYMLNDMIIDGNYVRNEHSRKIFKIRHNGTNKQRDCLATHLALQLSGLA